MQRLILVNGLNTIQNNDTAVDKIVSTAVSDLATAFNFDTMQRYQTERCNY